MKDFAQATQEFIRTHVNEDVRALALQAAKYPDVDMSAAVQQIAGYQIASRKIPSWASVEQIRYPRHLSMEQCSSEQTARYKASLIKGDTLVDLTAGLGVDCSFLARNFKQVTYVERQEELCELAHHNFPLLGLSHITVCKDDACSFLEKMEPVDCIFLDPARRDSRGGKTVALADCEPNVIEMEPLLISKAKTVMIKLSPMLDITSALHDLKYISQIHLVSVQNECKELLLILKSEQNNQPVEIHCEQLINKDCSNHFAFTVEEERNSSNNLADNILEYLYEPDVTLLKAGAYRILSSRFPVYKLHINSHLFTSSQYLSDFPGRHFQVVGVSGFGKKEIKHFLEGVEKANLTVRNFPSTVADLRKRLKLKEGGELYIFATTLWNDEKVLIKCIKA